MIIRLLVVLSSFFSLLAFGATQTEDIYSVEYQKQKIDCMAKYYKVLIDTAKQSGDEQARILAAEASGNCMDKYVPASTTPRELSSEHPLEDKRPATIKAGAEPKAKYSATKIGFSEEVNRFLENAQSALAAYGQNDSEAWEKLVCQSPTKHTFEYVRRFIGNYENVRLVTVMDKRSAANTSPQQWIEVGFEGKADNYPMPDHKLVVKFADVGAGCLSIMW
ncbi:MAG: hypothetical protein H6R17_2248 [Proteobacteria bacterium]|nr:hypothetical protein [Pseudomonadota bacterium]